MLRKLILAAANELSKLFCDGGVCSSDAGTGMHSKFEALVEGLHEKYEALLVAPAYQFGAIPRSMPKCGVYLFSEGGFHLYVGRSNRLRERYFLHCRSGSRQNQASFAYKLSREAIGITSASYKFDNLTRVGLSARSDFIEKFEEAKARIRIMEYRFVEERDQIRQALLESYCAIVLDTPYNDFDTH